MCIVEMDGLTILLLLGMLLSAFYLAFALILACCFFLTPNRPTINTDDFSISPTHTILMPQVLDNSAHSTPAVPNACDGPSLSTTAPDNSSHPSIAINKSGEQGRAPAAGEQDWPDVGITKANCEFIWPPITLFKPLKGTEHELAANLRSFLEQDYAVYQVIFAASESHDPALQLARELQKGYPHRDIHVMVTSKTLGPNAKVSNLLQMSQQAKYDLWVVADSDMRVGPNYLKQVVAPLLEQDVGLVTCLYRGRTGPGWGGALEALSIGCDFLPGVMVARYLQGMTFALGATMAFKRQAFEQIGGFKGLLDYLADDYLLGNRIYRAGWRIELSPYIIDSVGAPVALRDYWVRQVRWARTYRVCQPWGYLGSIITHGSTWALAYGIYTGLWWLPGLYLSGRLLHAAAIIKWILRDTTLLRYLPWLLLRDWLATVIWVLSFLGNHVQWRDRRFRLEADGRIRELPCSDRVKH